MEVPALNEWLTNNDLIEVSEQIEKQFKELNCQLNELLTFSTQDLNDFAKNELQLPSVLSRNRFVAAVLKLQNSSRPKIGTNESSQKEKEMLQPLQNKMYATIFL